MGLDRGEHHGPQRKTGPQGDEAASGFLAVPHAHAPEVEAETFRCLSLASKLVVSLKQALGPAGYLPTERQVFYIAEEVRNLVKQAMVLVGAAISSPEHLAVLSQHGLLKLGEAPRSERHSAEEFGLSPPHEWSLDYRALLGFFTAKVRGLNDPSAAHSSPSLASQRGAVAALLEFVMNPEAKILVPAQGGEPLSISEALENVSVPESEFAAWMTSLKGAEDFPQSITDELNASNLKAVADYKGRCALEIARKICREFDLDLAPEIKPAGRPKPDHLYTEQKELGRLEQTEVRRALAFAAVTEPSPERIRAALELGFSVVDATLEFQRERLKTMESHTAVLVIESMKRGREEALERIRFFIKILGEFKTEIEKFYAS